MITACGALRCTYDFDRFAPTTADAAGGGAGQTASVSDASSGGPIADQSAVVVDSAGEPAIDATSSDAHASDASSMEDAGCGVTCINTSKTCVATCNSTSDKCVADCNKASCRNMCMTTRTTCLVGCVNKCQTCTREAGCEQSAPCTATAQ